MTYFAESASGATKQFDTTMEASDWLDDLDTAGDVTMGVSLDKPRMLVMHRAANGYWESNTQPDEDTDAGSTSDL